MQVSQLEAQLTAAQEQVAELNSRAEALRTELAAAHAARAEDIKTNVALLQVGSCTYRFGSHHSEQ